MQPGASHRPKSIAVDSVTRSDKYSDSRLKQILKIFLAVVQSPRKILAMQKLIPPARLVVIVTVQHDFITAFRYTLAKIVNERPVRVERMNRPGSTKPLRDTPTRSSPVKWNHS
jgi:hypothetical protein